MWLQKPYRFSFSSINKKIHLSKNALENVQRPSLSKQNEKNFLFSSYNLQLLFMLNCLLDVQFKCFKYVKSQNLTMNDAFNIKHAKFSRCLTVRGKTQNL